MKKAFSKIALCSILAASVTSTTVLAESMAAQIKKRATEIAELKAMLNDPDQSMRLAALDTMLKSEDTAMRELAYNVGLNSADDAVRSITLRNKFNELSTLSINTTLSENADGKTKDYFTKYAKGGAYILAIQSYDEKKGTYIFKAPNGSSTIDHKGTISGLSLSFKAYNCNGTLTLNEESEFQGNLNCEGRAYSAKATVL
jgi:hypothetical protein